MPGEEKGVAKADKNSIGAPPNPACTAELRGVWPDTGLSTSICCRSGDLAFHARVSTNIRSDWVNQPVRRQHLRVALLESAAGSGKVGLFRAACQNHAAAFPYGCAVAGSRGLLGTCSQVVRRVLACWLVLLSWWQSSLHLHGSRLIALAPPRSSRCLVHMKGMATCT